MTNPTSGDSAKTGPWQKQAGESGGLRKSDPPTPEIVKSEAARGDLMLRAFVFVLAVLMASTEIADTATLVHVKTGEYLAAHGWIPSGKEVFSYTAEGRRWINLSWLFDLTVGGVYAAGGAELLTIFKAVLAAATFFLVLRCVRPGVSTWWGSLAAALALLTVHPQFTAQPELVTLLGLALVMWMLHRWQQADALRGGLWGLVPVFVVWSNLDNRMFLGLALLALYAAGEFVGSLLGSSGIGQSERRRHLWAVLGVCVLAACLNPFGISALTEPLRLYGVEYPALRDHYADSSSAVHLANMPLFRWSVMQRPHVVAGLVLLASAFVTMALNRRQLDYGHLFVLLGFLGFAALASHELAAAAVVACVIATTGGQDWYRDNFSQTYSVDFKARVFSVGGRAATVLALFAIAFLAASGRLNDPARRRIGLGFTPAIETTITGLGQDIQDSFDNRPFHFGLRQGDLLIWLDREPFIDSRVPVYSGTGPEDLIALHRRTGQALYTRSEGLPFSGRDEIWRAVFDRFRVTHVLPQLSGNSPDYRAFFSLQSGRWQVTKLGSMTAPTYRTDTRRQDPELDRYLKTRNFNVVREAFRQEASEVADRPGWPRSRSTLQNLVSKPRLTRSVPAQTALHYARFLQRYRDQQGRMQLSPDYAAAIAHLAIRYANRALAEDPNCADALEVLGDSYSILSRLETSISRAGGGSYDGSRRYRQTIAAYNQAILLEPQRAGAWLGLFYAYRDNNKHDLALKALREFEALTEFESDPSEEVQQQQSLMQRRLKELEAQVEPSLQQIEIQVTSPSANRLQVAQFAYGSGCVQRALELLEQEPELMSDRPDAQIFYGLLLGEAGRVEEADDLFHQFEGAVEEYGLSGWQTAAAWSALAGGDYDRAARLWTESKDLLIQRQLSPLLAPLATTGATLLWTPFHSQAARAAIEGVRRQAVQALFHVGLTYLEAGRNREATNTFRQILTMNPGTGYRPLVGFYLFQLTGEPIAIRPPSPPFPLDPLEIFTPEAKEQTESGAPLPPD